MGEISAFLQPGNTSLLSACALEMSQGALIQGPRGGTGKKQECKGISRLHRCRVTSSSTPRSSTVAPRACFVTFVILCYCWLLLAEETPEEQVLAVLVPQNMPLQPLCCCGICQCSTPLAKHRGRYLSSCHSPIVFLHALQAFHAL